MSDTRTVPQSPTPRAASTSAIGGATGSRPDRSDEPALRVVPWADPIADPHGLQPCSRYVELYWLPIIGPSTTWLLRRLSYGLEVHAAGFELDMREAARALGLGERMGRNAPFRRALQRLCTFGLARPHGPGAIAVRTRIPPLPLRHLSRLPDSLQAGHRTWLVEQRMSEPELMKRRARRLAKELASEGRDRADVERQLGAWQFHPAVAFAAAHEAFATVTPGPSSLGRRDRLAFPGTSSPTASPGRPIARATHGDDTISRDRPRDRPA